MSADTHSWQEKAKHFDFQGHQIAYWTGGREDARPLLLVHGFPTCAWDWAKVWDQLGTNHRLIACDMLGFGLSDKPRGGFGGPANGKGYTIHWQTDLQAALLDHLGIGEFDALVHDYGVSVGQEMLARQHSGFGFAMLGQCLFLNGGIFPDQHRPVTMQKIGHDIDIPLTAKPFEIMQEFVHHELPGQHMCIINALANVTPKSFHGNLRAFADTHPRGPFTYGFIVGECQKLCLAPVLPYHWKRTSYPESTSCTQEKGAITMSVTG